MNKLKEFFRYLISPRKRSCTASFGLVIILYLVMSVLIRTGNVSSLIKGLLIPLCSYIVAALALNLTVGILGDLSLGQAGFMSVGAFTGAVVSASMQQTTDSQILILIVSILVGTLTAAFFGALVGIPVLKLEGDYLAIVTLAFGQIVKTLISNLYVGIDPNGLQFSFVEDRTHLASGGKMIINGPSGLSGNTRMSTFTVGFVLILITLLVIYHLLESRYGRAIMATRDNKVVALTVGINTSKYKLITFVISAALTGAAGVLYAMNFSSITPAKFDFNLSIFILIYVVLGGLGNMTGTIVSTIVLMLLPELLRELNDYRMIIYALILIAIMLITNNRSLRSLYEKLFRRKEKKNVQSTDL